MNLFILRHGMTTESDSDERRELSEKGVKEVEDVVRLRRDDLRDVTRIYSSPHIRVKQTLEVASRILAFQGPIVESQYLTTGSRLNEIVSFVGELDLIPNGSLLAIDVEEPAQGAGKILWQESRNSSQVKRTTGFVDQF
jgi:phosphohistidine phosphatase SixA